MKHYINRKFGNTIETIDSIDSSDYKTKGAYYAAKNDLYANAKLADNQVYLSSSCTKEWRRSENEVKFGTMLLEKFVPAETDIRPFRKEKQFIRQITVITQSGKEVIILREYATKNTVYVVIWGNGGCERFNGGAKDGDRYEAVKKALLACGISLNYSNMHHDFRIDTALLKIASSMRDDVGKLYVGMHCYCAHA